jgi:tRNA pseudouridine38-40 synthase
MRNIRLLVEYEGTNYHGWQSQTNARGIQDILEEAIVKLTQEKVRLVAAGRTDRGVHARGQVVNFYLQKELPINKIYMGINSYLPRDIVVKKTEEVHPDFNSRFDAKQRVYQYFIHFERTALYRNLCWQLFVNVDNQQLFSLAEAILGEHDFSSFCRLETQTNHKRCQVYESSWRWENDFLIYRIAANRFLHGMVRTLVGTMIDVGRGKLSPDQFNLIVQSKDRTRAGNTAPARGLFLEEVVY